MKLRNGFVSNSSSASFIIYLPDDFDIRKHLTKTKFEKLIYEIGDKDIEYNNFCDTFNNLLIKEKIFYQSNNTFYFSIMCNLIEILDCEITSYSSDSEESGVIINLDKNDVLAKLKISNET